MKAYVIFQQRRDFAWDNSKHTLVSIPPVLEDLCGSDCMFILDGRNNLNTMKADCQERMYKLRHVQPGICGYKIYKGERLDKGRLIYQWVRSGWDAPKS